MSLEKLIIPFKEIDLEVHKQYERLGKYLDNKGPKTRYVVATASNLFSMPGNNSIAFPFIFFHAIDLSMNIVSLFVGDKMKEQISEGSATANPYTYYPMKVFEITRTPFLGLGAFYLGKGSYEMLDSVINKTPITPESVDDFLDGIYFMATATSMFLKDKDPKALDKDSVLSKLGSKVSELTHTSKPVPIPIHN